MNPLPTGLDHETYLQTLLTDPEQAIFRISTLDGAGLYKITDDHYVCVECVKCKHRGRALLERVLPREWECFHSAVNEDDGFQVFHYGPVL